MRWGEIEDEFGLVSGGDWAFGVGETDPEDDDFVDDLLDLWRRTASPPKDLTELEWMS